MPRGWPLVRHYQARGAYIQALNLPLLTLLRVLTVHAPAVLLPATALALVANHVADLGLAWWQLLVIWSLWPITAVPHAIVEYFLIERLVLRTLDRLEPLVGEAIMAPMPHALGPTVLWLLFGMPVEPPQIIRTSTGTQLAWLFFFVSLMPMGVLGASVYLKITALGSAATALPLGALGRWIVCLIVLNVGVNVAIVTLASQRVHEAMQALLGTMQQILEGDLSGHWSPARLTSSSTLEWVVTPCCWACASARRSRTRLDALCPGTWQRSSWQGVCHYTANCGK